MATERLLMFITGVIFGFIGLIFMATSVHPLGKFKNINKRLERRYGTKPNLWEKWRGDYPSNEAWKGLVTQISFHLLFGIIFTIMGIVLIYTIRYAA
jgi:hypothetical protein